LDVLVNQGAENISAGSFVRFDLNGVTRTELVNGEGGWTCEEVEVQVLKVRVTQDGPNAQLFDSLNILTDVDGARLYPDGDYYFYPSVFNVISDVADIQSDISAHGSDGSFYFFLPMDGVSQLADLTNPVGNPNNEKMLNTRIAGSYTVDFEVKLDTDEWITLSDLLGHKLDFDIVSAGEPQTYDGIPGQEPGFGVDQLGSQYSVVLGDARSFDFSVTAPQTSISPGNLEPLSASCELWSSDGTRSYGLSGVTFYTSSSISTVALAEGIATAKTGGGADLDMFNFFPEETFLYTPVSGDGLTEGDVYASGWITDGSDSYLVLPGCLDDGFDVPNYMCGVHGTHFNVDSHKCENNLVLTTPGQSGNSCQYLWNGSQYEVICTCGRDGYVCPDDSPADNVCDSLAPISSLSEENVSRGDSYCVCNDVTHASLDLATGVTTCNLDFWQSPIGPALDPYGYVLFNWDDISQYDVTFECTKEGYIKDESVAPASTSELSLSSLGNTAEWCVEGARFVIGKDAPMQCFSPEIGLVDIEGVRFTADNYDDFNSHIPTSASADSDPNVLSSYMTNGFLGSLPYETMPWQIQYNPDGSSLLFADWYTINCGGGISLDGDITVLFDSGTFYSLGVGESELFDVSDEYFIAIEPALISMLDAASGADQLLTVEGLVSTAVGDVYFDPSVPTPVRVELDGSRRVVCLYSEEIDWVCQNSAEYQLVN